MAGCAGRHDSDPPAGQVRVKVANIGFDNSSGTHYVVLRDSSGDRTLQIMIGGEEARAILFELRGVKSQRPLTQDLLQKVIERTGNHVDRVVITGVHNQIYYANIYMDRGKLRLDSRPSDAIALAMGTGAPIFVAGKLFRPAGDFRHRAPSAKALPATVSAGGIVVQNLGPALASYFGVAPRSGVLVAAVSGPAARAGLRRGDIVLEIESSPIHTSAEFVSAMAAFKDHAHETFIVKRGRRTHVITLQREKVASGN